MLNKDLTDVELTFSTADGERLAILTKEVQERLDEILKIAAAGLNVPVDNLRAKFVPEQKTFFSGMHIEILDNIKGQTCCVVWEAWPNGPAKLFCPC